MRKCTKCGTEKQIDEFHRKGTGRKTVCATCCREYGRSHYAANKDTYRETAKKHRDETRRKNRDYVRKLKESAPCTDCRQKYPYYVMQFDHLGDKERNVADMMQFPRARLEAEIQKCEIVCANCHAVRTYTRMWVIRAKPTPNRTAALTYHGGWYVSGPEERPAGTRRA